MFHALEQNGTNGTLLEQSEKSYTKDNRLTL